MTLLVRIDLGSLSVCDLLELATEIGAELQLRQGVAPPVIVGKTADWAGHVPFEEKKEGQ